MAQLNKKNVTLSIVSFILSVAFKCTIVTFVRLSVLAPIAVTPYDFASAIDYAVYFNYFTRDKIP